MCPDTIDQDFLSYEAGDFSATLGILFGDTGSAKKEKKRGGTHTHTLIQATYNIEKEKWYLIERVL